MAWRIACLGWLAMVLVGTSCGPAAAQEKRQDFKFDFGPGKVEPGYVQVLPSTAYTKERGFGFEPGAKVEGVDRGGPDALRGNFCTSDKPFAFSVAVPEGN